MKKIIAMLMCLVMCFSLLTACGGSSGGTSSTNGSASASTGGDASTSADASTPADSSEDATPSGEAPDVPTAPLSDNLTGTLQLGTIGPLTGSAALYGTAVANAAEIATAEINAFSDSFQIELSSQDDEHDAEKSVNAYNKLKDWGAQVIVGSTTSTPCVAVAAEAYADRMFMLTPSASSSDVTKGRDNVYQICFTDPNQGIASAECIAELYPDAKIAMIYNNSDGYSTGIAQAFETKAEELGLNIVSVTTFPSDDTIDFTVQLGDAMSNGADLLFLPIYYTPASLIMQTAANMSYAVSIVGVDGMDGILDLEGFDVSLAEGVVMLTPFSASASDAATVSFVSKYQDAYGEIPNQFAADSYDCVYAIYAALSYYADANGGLDVTGMSYSELCEILISVFSDAGFSVDGLTGISMTWSANGEVNKAPKSVVIKDGAYVGM